MNRFGIVLGSLAAAALLVLFGTQLPSCASFTPEKNAKLLKLADIGLTVAQSQGAISPGDRLLIGETAAILFSSAPQDTKLMNLAAIGLDQAVKEGVLKPGDTVLVKDALEVIVTPPPSPEAASAVDTLASEMAKPPAVDATSGK